MTQWFRSTSKTNSEKKRNKVDGTLTVHEIWNVSPFLWRVSNEWTSLQVMSLEITCKFILKCQMDNWSGRKLIQCEEPKCPGFLVKTGHRSILNTVLYARQQGLCMFRWRCAAWSSRHDHFLIAASGLFWTSKAGSDFSRDVAQRNTQQFS